MKSVKKQINEFQQWEMKMPFKRIYNSGVQCVIKQTSEPFVEFIFKQALLIIHTFVIKYFNQRCEVRCKTLVLACNTCDCIVSV